MQQHNVVVEKVLQYRIITDHYNADAIRMKMLLNSKNISFTEKTLHTEDQLRQAKVMGIKEFPTIYTKDNDPIGGLQELIHWLDQFE